jgi:hypothetical protein
MQAYAQPHDKLERCDLRVRSQKDSPSRGTSACAFTYAQFPRARVWNVARVDEAMPLSTDEEEGRLRFSLGKTC